MELLFNYVLDYFRSLGSQQMLTREQTGITNFTANFAEKWQFQTKFDITSAHITDCSRITALNINQALIRTNLNTG